MRKLSKEYPLFKTRMKKGEKFNKHLSGIPGHYSKLSRREALSIFGWMIGLVGIVNCGGCQNQGGNRDGPISSLFEDSWKESKSTDENAEEGPIAANIKALLNTLIPAEYDENGVLISPGALEANVYQTISIDRFVVASRNIGLVPQLPALWQTDSDNFDEALKGSISAVLDTLAAFQLPLTPFRALPLYLQNAAIEEGFASEIYRPILQFVRAACFVAFLGAIDSDLGLQVAGFPAFEDFEEGIAVRGYPRTLEGDLVDPTNDDLLELEAAGNLDTYTYNRVPRPTPDDDLSLVINADGDLI